MKCTICGEQPILSVRLIEPTSEKEHKLHCFNCPPMYTEWHTNEDDMWEEWRELCKEENK